MLQKVKDRRKTVILSKTKEIENDLCMILSSHGYAPDLVSTFEDAAEKIIYYKPPLFIADIELLPEFPNQIMKLFQKARKTPAFLIIDNSKHVEKLNRYVEFTDDILRVPFAEDSIYYKIKKAVLHNEIAQDNQYYLGMLLMLKLISPVLLLIVLIITAGAL
ncbi:MAG: hypothetical protein FWE23_01640 [Chitinivibrionia bacterium]|nr:hypothetical protein [Chitinivibrionia bacterium]